MFFLFLVWQHIGNKTQKNPLANYKVYPRGHFKNQFSFWGVLFFRLLGYFEEKTLKPKNLKLDSRRI